MPRGLRSTIARLSQDLSPTTTTRVAQLASTIYVKSPLLRPRMVLPPVHTLLDVFLEPASNTLKISSTGLVPSLGDTPLPLFWMRGPTGVGKSAIAQTCAERLQKLGVLCATFFFSISGQRQSEKFFPSIVYQLSTVYPAYRDLIDKKVHHDRTLVDKAMQFQFQYLIDEPLRELEEKGKGIRKRIQVLVDGLDECEGADAQCEIIRIITSAVSGGVIPLRWAFFSRPEPHIEAMPSSPDIATHCYKAMLPISRDADGEIDLYLRNCFRNILQRHNTSVRAPWPSAKDMKTLVNAADGSFIYATTVIRFVGHPDSLGPQKRLRAIVNIILFRHYHAGTGADAPFAELDAFYVLILQRVPTKIFPSVHLLLAIMCRHGALSAIAAANLLELSKDEFETTCKHVNAIVHFEDPAETSSSTLPPTIVVHTRTPAVIPSEGIRTGDKWIECDDSGERNEVGDFKARENSVQIVGVMTHKKDTGNTNIGGLADDTHKDQLNEDCDSDPDRDP